MQDYDDEPVQRPKWVGWLIIIGMILVVLGLVNLGVRMMVGTESDQSAAAKVQAITATNPQLAAGKKLIDGGDCMRCHGVDKEFVGPSFMAIANRYHDREDALPYLASKIRSGSVGEWGRTIMPRHPQVTEADALQMSAWLMALYQPALPPVSGSSEMSNPAAAGQFTVR